MVVAARRGCAACTGLALAAIADCRYLAPVSYLAIQSWVAWSNRIILTGGATAAALIVCFCK